MKKETGIINIRGREYMTVARRVSDFRNQYKIEDGWSIQTELIRADDQAVIMKASILHAGNVLATGYAEEDRSTTGVNSTSALENAETSAIGRALAAAGFSGQEYASANEVENALRQEAAKKNGKATPPAKQKIDTPRLAKMIKAIQAGQFTVEKAKERFDRTADQLAAINLATEKTEA